MGLGRGGVPRGGLPRRSGLDEDDVTVQHFVSGPDAVRNRDLFFEHVGRGGSVASYLRDRGLSAPMWTRLLDVSDEVCRVYASALKFRAVEAVDGMGEDLGRMLDGTLSAQELGAASKVRQWMASRFDAERFGERSGGGDVVNIDLRGAIIDARRRVEVSVEPEPEPEALELGAGVSRWSGRGDRVVPLSGEFIPAGEDAGDVL